jgi:hypothetical protein
MKIKNKTAGVLIDYILIFGVASLVLTAMQTYVKRGLQGRVKEMTDYFISGEQEVKIDPSEIESLSRSSGLGDLNNVIDTSTGGPTLITDTDTVKTEVSYRTVVEDLEMDLPLPD